MFLRCLLVPTAPGIDATPRLDAALRLGRRLHAHIGVAFLAPGPEHVLAGLASLVPVDDTTIEAIAQGVRESAADGKAALRAWCTRHGVAYMPAGERLDATFATWTELSGEVEPLLTRLGRINDLVVVDRPDPARPFTGARPRHGPVLRRTADPDDRGAGGLRSPVPRGGGVERQPGGDAPDRPVHHPPARGHARHRPPRPHRAFRRVRGGGPRRLSALARRGGGDRDPAGPGGDPGRRGDPGGGRGPGRLHAALGAYTHSRVREFLLGGVTRHVIANARMPVLLAH